jgi:hypothetical protein
MKIECARDIEIDFIYGRNIIKITHHQINSKQRVTFTKLIASHAT